MVRQSPSRDRLLRTLLNANARNMPRAPRTPKISSLYGLAKATDVSFSWVHHTIRQLEALGFVSADKGVHVRNAENLFAWWRDNSAKPEIVSFHAPDPLQLLVQATSRAKAPYALTTYYAENRIQGHLFPRRVDAYIQAKDLPVIRALILAGGGQLGGSNLRLWMRDDHVPQEAYQSSGPQPLWYAPTAQVILDLYQEGASAAEAADMLVKAAYANPRLRVSPNESKRRAPARPG